MRLAASLKTSAECSTGWSRARCRATMRHRRLLRQLAVSGAPTPPLPSSSFVFFVFILPILSIAGFNVSTPIRPYTWLLLAPACHAAFFLL
uniref:Uncharacterized protein n=1 Tax=Physcomitrium patens TaxID=3218 RepID=A0A2K1L403_PHYPA|nr:hypothetical protein PHYPA_003547 [Physcomitrium patens]